MCIRDRSAHRFEADAKIEFRAGGPLGKIQFPGGCSDSESREAFDQFIAKWSTDPKWNPSIFMPKEAARTFLKIVDISVERLGDINGGGLKAEGIDRNQPYRAMRMDFRDLWNSTSLQTNSTSWDGMRTRGSSSTSSSRSAERRRWHETRGYREDAEVLC